MIFALLPVFPAAAEDVSGIIEHLDMSEMQSNADKLGADIDIKETILSIMAGEIRLDADLLRNIWSGIRDDALKRIRDVLAMFMLPFTAAAVLRRISPVDSRAGELICACGCSAMFIELITEAFSSAGYLITGIAGLLESTVPILTALSAMGGGTSSAALLTPMSTLIGETMAQLMGKWGMAAVASAAACACAAALSPAVRLDGFFDFLKRTVQVGTGLMLALFSGILKVQGMLGSSFDSAAVKTARYAVDKIVPSIGGGIADTLDATLSSIGLIKCAVGVTGMGVIAVACAEPLMRLTSALLAMRVARAVALPVADTELLRATERFGDVLRLMVVLSAAAVTLGLILLGAAIGAGKSVSG